MGKDWYPRRLDELDQWHSTFAAQCAATGTMHGLTAAQVTQAGVDAPFVSVLLNFDPAIRGYLQAWTQYRNIILRGDPTEPLPPLPTLPPPPSPPFHSNCSRTASRACDFDKPRNPAKSVTVE